MVVCDINMIRYKGVVGAPNFVLEVLSVSTARRDLTSKLHLYQKCGVKEYWIIDPDKKRLIVYTSEEDYMPEIHTLEETIEVKIYNGELKIDLSEIKKICEQV